MVNEKTMVNVTVNGQSVSVPAGVPIMGAARRLGIRIPTLCAAKKLSDVGVCRVCVVEVEGIERLVPACNTPVEEGMVIRTETPRVLETRRTNVSLMLSQHCIDCAICVRNGNCVLQSLAQELNILEVPYKKEIRTTPWNGEFPLIRDGSKCVRCLRCVQVCEKIQHCNVWDIVNRATRLDVGVRDGLSIGEAGCTLCGQCVTHCPTGALHERDDINVVLEALADPEVVTVVQVAPAVRTSWAEDIGIDDAEATEGRMAAAFRAVGFDYVFDTNFAADLTIMEEGTEFIQRLQAGENLPLLTSCCPGWVRYLKAHHPEFVDNLSSAKSPQQMFGAMLKEYVGPKLGMVPTDNGEAPLEGVREGAGLGYGVGTNPQGRGSNDIAALAAQAEGGDTTRGIAKHPQGKRIFSVSCMPCVAKKYECAVEEMVRASDPDVDAVITVRELDRLLRMMNINVAYLEETPFDDPMDEGSGAAVIFGATGGVMEAALRSAYFLVTGENPDPEAFTDVRGLDGWKEKTFDMAGTPVRVAVASGLGNADKLLNAVAAGEVEYDFIEVMACPGGCAGGGGQPIHEGKELAGERGSVLYDLDKKRETRFSHENPNITKAYEEFLGEPNSEKAHHLLHTDQSSWKL